MPTIRLSTHFNPIPQSDILNMGRKPKHKVPQVEPTTYDRYSALTDYGTQTVDMTADELCSYLAKRMTVFRPARK